jgi:hypothetical protein
VSVAAITCEIKTALMRTCMDSGFPASALRESDSQVWTVEDDQDTSDAIENVDTESKVRLDGLTANNHVTR